MHISEQFTKTSCRRHAHHRPHLLRVAPQVLLHLQLRARYPHWPIDQTADSRPTPHSYRRRYRPGLPPFCWTQGLRAWINKHSTLSMAAFSSAVIWMVPGGGCGGPPYMIRRSNSSGFSEISWNSCGEVCAICCRNTGRDDGSFLIICWICANWGEFTSVASIEASRPEAPVVPVVAAPGTGAGGAWPCPWLWVRWAVGGRPLTKYSTARSGLL